MPVGDLAEGPAAGSGLSRPGEDRGRRRGARGRQGTLSGSRRLGCAAALRIVALGQVQQAPPCERIGLVGEVAHALCKASVEFQLHHATPVTVLRAIQDRREAAVKTWPRAAGSFRGFQYRNKSGDRLGRASEGAFVGRPAYRRGGQGLFVVVFAVLSVPRPIIWR